MVWGSGKSAFRRAAFAVKTATIRRSAGRMFDDLQRTEMLPREEIERMQRAAAVALARRAYDGSDFSRDRFDAAGVRPEDLDQAEAWHRLTPLTRTDLKDAGTTRLTVPDPESLRIGLTSGSTAEPLTTYQDPSRPSLPPYWRMIGWWGVHPSDDVVHVGRWGPNSWKQRLVAWPTREIMFDAVRFDTADIDALIDAIQRVRPALIEGYAGALQEIADRIREREVDLPAPRAVATTASPLTASVRHQLSSAFQAPVFDQYRSAEVPWIAAECAARDGLHVFADQRIVEVVDDDGHPVPDGVEGDLVITDLTNRVAPLIRYRIGDRGAMRAAPCPCGRGLPVMEPVRGRLTDTLRLPDGAVITAGFPALFDHDPDAARRFQIHQHADHSLTLRVVPGRSSGDPAALSIAVAALESLVLRQAPVRLEIVDHLPLTAGKPQYVISEVADGD